MESEGQQRTKGNDQGAIPTVQTRLKVGSKLPPLTLGRPCSGRRSFWGRKKSRGVNNFEGSAGNIARTGRDGQLRMTLGDLADCKSRASLTKHYGGILEEGSRRFAAFLTITAVLSNSLSFIAIFCSLCTRSILPCSQVFFL